MQHTLYFNKEKRKTAYIPYIIPYRLYSANKPFTEQTNKQNQCLCRSTSLTVLHRDDIAAKLMPIACFSFTNTRMHGEKICAEELDLRSTDRNTGIVHYYSGFTLFQFFLRHVLRTCLMISNRAIGDGKTEY